jgi:hypothetical protein
MGYSGLVCSPAGLFSTEAIFAFPLGVENLSLCRMSVPGCFSSGQGQRRPPIFEIRSLYAPWINYPTISI